MRVEFLCEHLASKPPSPHPSLCLMHASNPQRPCLVLLSPVKAKPKLMRAAAPSHDNTPRHAMHIRELSHSGWNAQRQCATYTRIRDIRQWPLAQNNEETEGTSCRLASAPPWPSSCHQGLACGHREPASMSLSEHRKQSEESELHCKQSE